MDGGGSIGAMPGSGEHVTIVYGPELASYSFSEQHPLQAGRYVLTMSLLSALGWLEHPGITFEAPRFASLSELLTVHSYAYLQAVQTGQAIARGERPAVDLQVFGLGTSDDPLFPNIHDAAALYTGATIQAMTAVLEERAVHAYSPAGGQHHAHRSQASGFCIYNDCAAAAAAAIAAGRRVAYIDFDAHHGDGVQAAFYDDPRALTISIHESGQYLFPGTGDSSETGRGDGLGACLNIPLPAFAGDEALLQAFERVIEPAVRAYAPDIIITQTGVDAHHADPLTHLTATLPLYPRLASRLHDLVHECSSGRWVIVGGGGYDPTDVTPRAWTAFIGTVLGRDVENVTLPEEWLRASRAAGGDPPPTLLQDPGPSYAPLESADFNSVLDEVERTALAGLLARYDG
ncbi:MAG: acetoin utilization protein AcuC [Thermoleophilia bacterium]|nr:acetoin utilization protein AcuC [Thermoleophilia bacterium]